MTDKNITINITDNEDERVALVDKGQKNEVYSKEQIDEQANNYAKINNVYSKTEIDDKYNVQSFSKSLRASSSNVYASNFVDTVSNGNYLITIGYGSGLINTVRYSSNLYVQGNDTFFNLSVDPFSRNAILTAGNIAYNGAPTSSTGWSRNLAFTVNDVAISAPGFNNTSLRELKENIEDYNENALDLINNLKIVKYDYKDDNAPKNMIGVIVDDESTADDFKDESGNAINIYKMISILTKSVQELSTKIIELKSVTTSD